MLMQTEPKVDLDTHVYHIHLLQGQRHSAILFWSPKVPKSIHRIKCQSLTLQHRRDKRDAENAILNTWHKPASANFSASKPQEDSS